MITASAQAWQRAAAANPTLPRAQSAAPRGAPAIAPQVSAPVSSPSAFTYSGSIAPGTVGPGGAKFGMGAGGPNRFDYTQYGGGLWSIGIDPNAPDVDAQVQRWFNSQPAAVQADVRRGLASNGNSLTRAADWRGRDVARKIQKSNKFFDTGFGKILGTVAPVAAAFLPGGQFLAPAVGATIGGVRGGLTGALIGGAQGYLAGQAAPGVKDFFGNAGGFSTLVKAPATFASNLGRQALTSAQNYIPGYGGNVAAALGKTAAGLAVDTSRAASSAGGASSTGSTTTQQLLTSGSKLVDLAAGLGAAGAAGAGAALTSGATGVTNTDSALAGLIRAQDQYFNTRVKPLEQAALADINNPAMPRLVADRAGATARSAIDATQGMEQRQLSRFGVRPTADQQRSIARNFGLERAQADAGARNTAYGAMQDAQAELAGSALQIGRGVAGQSVQGLTTANSLSNARQTAANQAASADRAGTVSSMFTGAGLGAVLGSGEGGIGAFKGGLIGGGVGLLASMLF